MECPHVYPGQFSNEDSCRCPFDVRIRKFNSTVLKSKQTLSNQWTNQNSRQIFAASRKRRKTLARKSRASSGNRSFRSGYYALETIFESFSALQAITQNKRDSNVIETFRFKDENDYEYEIWLKVFSHILNIYTPRKASFYHFSLEKLAPLPSVNEVTPSPDRKMIKFLTVDNLFPLLRHFYSNS